MGTITDYTGRITGYTHEHGDETIITDHTGTITGYIRTLGSDTIITDHTGTIKGYIRTLGSDTTITDHTGGIQGYFRSPDSANGNREANATVFNNTQERCFQEETENVGSSTSASIISGLIVFAVIGLVVFLVVAAFTNSFWTALKYGGGTFLGLCIIVAAFILQGAVISVIFGLIGIVFDGIGTMIKKVTDSIFRVNR